MSNRIDAFKVYIEREEIQEEAKNFIISCMEYYCERYFIIEGKNAFFINSECLNIIDLFNIGVTIEEFKIAIDNFICDDFYNRKTLSLFLKRFEEFYNKNKRINIEKLLELSPTSIKKELIKMSEFEFKKTVEELFNRYGEFFFGDEKYTGPKIFNERMIKFGFLKEKYRI